MKIQDRQALTSIEAIERAEPKPAATSRSSSTGASVKLSATALALADDAGDATRSQAIASLKAAYERGDLKVDHQRVAAGIISDAEDSQ